MIKKFIIMVLLLIPVAVMAQDINERLGIPEELKTGLFYYNYGDKNKLNIEVMVWGYIKAPGKYLIPQGTKFTELLTLCGGPSNDTKLEDVRIVRLKNDSLGIKQDTLFNLNYDDYLWQDKISTLARRNPVLMPGDMIIFPLESRFHFRDNLYLILSITSTLVSITTFLVTVLRK
ncbi:MAG: SLBB domain-containing protein [Bacteroidetes bacterium]|nr:SLBB domain-containing protein [Bacteroidota bacterium]